MFVSWKRFSVNSYQFTVYSFLAANGRYTRLSIGARGLNFIIHHSAFIILLHSTTVAAGNDPNISSRNVFFCREAMARRNRVSVS